MSDFFLGSIDLSKIDKKLIKMVDFKDGTTRPILQLTISKRKEPSRYGDTHYISIAPKGTPKEERSKYIIGDLREWNDNPQKPSVEEIAASPAPSPKDEEDLPF